MNVAVLVIHEGGWLATLVSLFTWSFWNHVALKVGDKVYYMDSGKSFGKNNDSGLRECDYSYIAEKYPHLSFSIAGADEDKLMAFLHAHVDVKYDAKRTLGWVVRKYKTLDDVDRFNCIELVYYAFKSLGIDLWEGENISPGKLAKILRKRG